jgi:hypothetical protein
MTVFLLCLRAVDFLPTFTESKWCKERRASGEHLLTLNALEVLKSFMTTCWVLAYLSVEILNDRLTMRFY